MELSYLKRLVSCGGPLPEEYAELDELYSTIAKLPADRMPSVIDELRDILAPTLTLETMQGFAFCKPHGYAGDFEIIERIYERRVSDQKHLQRWDLYIHRCSAPRAVENRKAYFSDVVKSMSDKSCHILNIASGPGRDMFEALASSDAEHEFTCIDIDQNAITYAKELNSSFSDRITFHRSSALRFRSLQKFDLVWAGGLFDYFTDRLFVVTLKRLLSHLNERGECVIGNFGTQNPSRSLMEVVGDWHLYHRDPEHLTHLAVLAGAEPDWISVRSEPLGVNLFLHISKMHVER